MRIVYRRRVCRNEHVCAIRMESETAHFTHVASALTVGNDDYVCGNQSVLSDVNNTSRDCEKSPQPALMKAHRGVPDGPNLPEITDGSLQKSALFCRFQRGTKSPSMVVSDSCNFPGSVQLGSLRINPHLQDTCVKQMVHFLQISLFMLMAKRLCRYALRLCQ